MHCKGLRMTRIILITILMLSIIISTPAFSLTFNEAKHFLGRTGFQPSMSEISPYLTLNRKQAIIKRLAEINTYPKTPLPAYFKTPKFNNFDFKKASRTERMQFNKEQRKKMQTLQTWWLNEMLTTTSPMTENLTLFWHNHFVTSAQKVKTPELIAIQNQTCRRNTGGNFRAFLNDILQDPAMLRYLDNQQNRKDRPNENLARELLELFTLGEGNFTEHDIKTVAKILSGSGFDPKTGLFRFNPKQHDRSHKTLWGSSGHFMPKDLVELILQREEAAELITKKLWSRYITLPISKNSLQQLSKIFRKHYDIKTLINAILNQPEFWSTENMGSQIKSPIQLILGLHRQFENLPSNLEQTIKLAKKMNQNILYPPNVKGWKTGEHWIDTNSLIQRQNFLKSQTRGMTLLKKLKNQPDIDWQALLIYSGNRQNFNISKKITNSDYDEIRTILNTLFLRPEYQMQ